jgi:hypothetical protein
MQFRSFAGLPVALFLFVAGLARILWRGIETVVSWGNGYSADPLGLLAAEIASE